MTRSLRAALLFSAAILIMLVTVNLLTSPGYLWCIYPAFGVLWWPLSAYYKGRRQPLAYSLWGTALIAALLILTYLISSPGAHPWFLYPVLAVLWWPLSVYCSRKGARAFSVMGAALILLTLLTVNLVTSPGFLWCVYPAFFTLWWPLSVLLGKKAGTVGFAAASAAAAFAFTVLMHRIHSPQAMPWYLFTLMPFLWWPLSMVLRPRVDGVRLMLLGLVVFAAYYTALTAVLYAPRTLLAPCVLAGAAWAVYAMGLSKRRDHAGFAAVHALLLGGYCVFMHHVFTPAAHPWFWYAFFPLALWVYAAVLKRRAYAPKAALAAAAVFLAYYGALNLLLSPAVPWVLFLTAPAAAAVIGASYRGRALPLALYITAAGVLYFAVINWAFTPHALWAVYPAFALLWWPLSVWLRAPKAAPPRA